MNTSRSSHSGSPSRSPEAGPKGRTFGRHARLRTHAQISLIKRRGTTVAGQYCVVSTITPPPDSARRVGFIISRRYSSKAVQRNRARRVLREAYRQLYPELKPAWMALIPRARMHGAKTHQVVQELLRACRQLKVLKEPSQSQNGVGRR